jgi:DNA invertase Pin-like site-specific DNA recombinase
MTSCVINYISKEDIKIVVEMFLQGITYREIGVAVNLNAGQVSHIITYLRNNGADLPLRGGSHNKYARAAMEYLQNK